MKNVSVFYKDFLKYKLNSFSTYWNLIKKIHNFEDLRYMFGISKVALRMIFKKEVNNETVRLR